LSSVIVILQELYFANQAYYQAKNDRRKFWLQTETLHLNRTINLNLFSSTNQQRRFFEKKNPFTVYRV